MCHKFGKQLAHNSWSPHAHQLLCMRISAVMQAHNSCCATDDTDCTNNLYYLFQQLILSHSTTYPTSFNNISYIIQQQQEGESLTNDSPSFYLGLKMCQIPLA